MFSLVRTRVLGLFFLWPGLGYLAIQRIVPILSDRQFALTLPGETTIPFVPQMFVVYLAACFLPFLVILVVADERELKRIVHVFILTSLLHFAIFVSFPVHYIHRPALTGITSGVLYHIATLFYTWDDVTNCFPSMHVSMSFLCYHALKHLHPRWASLILWFAVAVAVSTILVKQHYILDVIFAVGLAQVMACLFNKPVTNGTDQVLWQKDQVDQSYCRGQIHS